MHFIESMRCHWLLPICFFVLTLMLMACGGVASTSSSSSSTNNGNSSGSTTSSSGSTTSNTGTPTVNGYATANGCPSNVVVSGGNAKANVIVKVTQMNQTIPVHNGDIIEMQFPFGHKWTGPTTSQGILQIQGPAGYASQSARACIWRFVAKGTGTAQLIFRSQALCQAGQACPMYMVVMPFEFNVK